jgi:hypothetical protein
VPQCAHTFHGTCTDTRKVTSDSHAPTRAARVRAQPWKGPLRGARTHGLATRTERIRTYHGTHGTAAPIGFYHFSQRARRVLGGDSRANGDRVRSGVVPARGAPAPRIRYSKGSRRMVLGARRGAYGHQRAGARKQAHGAASRARRAHRKPSLSSADSAAGTVPSSEFEPKDLRRAWFVPLCSEMLMHRSVPRTHTSTARGGSRTQGLTKRTGRVRTYDGTHGPAAPIGYHTFSQRARRVLGGDSRAYGNRVRSGAVRESAAPRRLGYGTRTAVGAMVLLPHYSQGYWEGTRGVLIGP